MKEPLPIAPGDPESIKLLDALIMITENEIMMSETFVEQLQKEIQAKKELLESMKRLSDRNKPAVIIGTLIGQA